jgi:tight adherence protein C
VPATRARGDPQDRRYPTMTGGMALSFAFFVFVMAAITVCGHVVLRHSTKLHDESWPVRTPSRAALVNFFRSIGEQFPAAHQEENKYRLQLARLDYRWPSAVAVFYGIKCTSALLISALLALALLLAMSGRATILPMLCGAGFGFLFPDRILAARIRARGRRLRSGIPAALDLMVLGLESGQSLDHTLEHTSRALRRTNADLSSEFSQVSLEIRARESRAEALRNLAERSGEPELRKLSNLLIDSDRFGTSLAPALRTHCKYLRIRYRQQAQETARKVGVKLIFPIFLLIFPSVLLVTLGPACIMMYQQLQILLNA